MASSFVPQAMLGQLPQGDASVESNFERRKSVDDVNGPGRDLKNPRRTSDHDAGSHKQKKSETAKPKDYGAAGDRGGEGEGRTNPQKVSTHVCMPHTIFPSPPRQYHDTCSVGRHYFV